MGVLDAPNTPMMGASLGPCDIPHVIYVLRNAFDWKDNFCS